MVSNIANKLLSSSVSLLEWLEFSLYGFLGPIFSQLFFPPNHSYLLSLINYYAVLFISYLSRPIGGLIFGYIGDKYGRMVSLRLTPLFITLASLAMALLPSYASIGIKATIALIAIRVIQGILMGGEYAGNMVYLYEMSTTWRHFWSCVSSCSASLGIGLASIIASLLYYFLASASIYHLGWRLPYFLLVPLGLAATYIRYFQPETIFFQTRNKRLKKNYVFNAKLLITCLGIICLHGTSFYFVFTFLPIFLLKIRHLGEAATMINNSTFLILHVSLIPLFGYLANFSNKLVANIWIAFIFFISSLPLFYCIAYSDGYVLYFSLLVLSGLTSFNAAIIPGLIIDLIPKSDRFTLLALTFNIGFGLFGGCVTFLSLGLIKQFNNILLPGLYLSLTALITLLTSLFFYRYKRLSHDT